jgi:biotin synthase-related radical SAM superfamily protein
MGSKVNPNVKPLEFAGSMAEAIENALNSALSADGMKTFAVNTNSQEARDRRRLFVAVAVGVVAYLKHNTNALTILDSLSIPTGESIVVSTDPGAL